MKPGPAISGGSQRSATSSRATMRLATSRGGWPSLLARRSATLDWKWPNWGLVAGRSSGSMPATASIRALSSDGREGTSRPLFHADGWQCGHQ